MLPQEQLNAFSANVEQLTILVADLRQQVRVLTEANNKQREEILRSHAELVELQKKYKDLLTAHALTADDVQKDRARRQITALINKIDKTLLLLNE